MEPQWARLFAGGDFEGILTALAAAMQVKADEQRTCYPGASQVWEREAKQILAQLYRMRYGCPRII